jgi:hypothetical protein
MQSGRAKPKRADDEEWGMDAGIDWTAEGAMQRVARMRVLASLLDNSLLVPGLNVRVGLDPILGLFPGGGDLIGLLAGLYIVYEAWQLGASGRVLALMVINILIDSAVGAIPVVGDLFDFAWKANTRNLELLGIDTSEPVRLAF